MECVVCKHGSTYNGYVTVKLERGDSIVLLKNVPAEICENCGHYYLSEHTAAAVFAKAEKAIDNGTELEVMKYKEVA